MMIGGDLLLLNWALVGLCSPLLLLFVVIVVQANCGDVDDDDNDVDDDHDDKTVIYSEKRILI